MRALIRRNGVKIEFTGRGQLWNEMLRPWFGGPEAPDERMAEEPSAAAAPQLPPHTASAARPHTASAAHPHTGSPAQVAPRPAPSVQFASHRSEPAFAAAAVGGPSSSGTQMRGSPSVPQRPATPNAPRTWYPPREPNAEPARQASPRPQAETPHPTHDDGQQGAVHDDDDAGIQIERSSHAPTLYSRLAALHGRRSERDAVLAAVWFLTKGEGEATGDEVERHFLSHGVFQDVKVVPHLLKHVHRTKMLEPGRNPKAVRLTGKGATYVHSRLVG